MNNEKNSTISALWQEFTALYNTRKVDDLDPLSGMARHIQSLSGYCATPLRVTVEITNQCNQRCIFCIQGQKKAKVEHLKPDHFADILDQLAHTNIPVITITGGEPTCHPSFMQFIEEIKEKNFGVRIETNGSGLTPKRVNRLARILDLHQDRIILALHASRSETHFSLHGDNNFHLVKTCLASCFQHSLPLETRTLVLRNNIDEIDEIADLASQYGVRRSFIGPPFRASQIDQRTFVSPDTVLRACVRIASKGNVIPAWFAIAADIGMISSFQQYMSEVCDAGFCDCFIDRLGRFGACSYSLDNNEYLGSIPENNLIDMWQKMTDMRLSKHGFCPISQSCFEMRQELS